MATPTQYQTNVRHEPRTLVGDKEAVITHAMAHFGVTLRDQLVVNQYASGDIGIRPRKGNAAWFWYQIVK